MQAIYIFLTNISDGLLIYILNNAKYNVVHTHYVLQYIVLCVFAVDLTSASIFISFQRV